MSSPPSFLPTPPTDIDDPEGTQTVDTAIHVLATAATALSLVTRMYQTDASAREAMLQATECILNTVKTGGKVVVCGIGKSGIVGMKLAATMKSLGIPCSFLHAAEALHGDMGDITPHDTMLFMSYSGWTPQLLSMLPHIPPQIPRIAISGHHSRNTCPLLFGTSIGILLPARVHEAEDLSFGVRAPTTSTTVAVCIGDALALAVADRLHCGREGMKNVFDRNHPGGSIGAATVQPFKAIIGTDLG